MVCSEQKVIGDDIIREVIADLEGAAFRKRKKMILYAAGLQD